MPRTLASALLVATLLCASPADAWHHWGGGYGGWGCGGCYGGGYGGLGYYGAGYYGGAYGPFGASPFIRPYVTLAPAYPPYPPYVAIPSIRPAVTATQPSALPPLTNTDLARVLSRVASVEARRKAERSLAEGDELFREQNYHSALQRYKLAASTAPDLAEAHWRKGHALVATHNYDLAIAAFKRALGITPETKRDAFKLDDIYGPAAMAKTLHFESLAEWALAHTDSPDAWLLVGVQLYFDGQHDRAQKFFARATALDAAATRYLAVFAPPAPAAPRAASTAIPPARLTSAATEL
jgi:tetratricopeptide (TPR) repeat protein